MLFTVIMLGAIFTTRFDASNAPQIPWFFYSLYHQASLAQTMNETYDI